MLTTTRHAAAVGASSLGLVTSIELRPPTTATAVNIVISGASWLKYTLGANHLDAFCAVAQVVAMTPLLYIFTALGASRSHCRSEWED